MKDFRIKTFDMTMMLMCRMCMFSRIEKPIRFPFDVELTCLCKRAFRENTLFCF